MPMTTRSADAADTDDAVDQAAAASDVSSVKLSSFTGNTAFPNVPAVAELNSLLRLIEDEPSEGQDLVTILTDDIPFETMFHPDVVRFQPIYRKIMRFLTEREVDLPSGPLSVRPMRVIARTIYRREPPETDSRSSTHPNQPSPSKTPQATVPHAAPVSTPGVSPPHSQESDRSVRTKNAQGIILRFKDRESKFSGELKQNVMEYFAAYEAACDDFELTPQEQLRYLHNLFSGDGLRTMHDIRSRLSVTSHENYLTVKQGVGQHYNTPARRNGVYNDMKRLVFDANATDPKEELARLVSWINRHFGEIPTELQHDRTKIECLTSALIQQPWASQTIQAFNAKPNPGFLDFTHNLDSAARFTNDMRKSRSTDFGTL